MKEKIASLVAEGIDEALRELMPVLDERFDKADERMLERVNLAVSQIKTIERGLPDPEAIREAVYGALKGQLDSLGIDVQSIKGRVEALRELKDGEPGRDGKDGLDGRDGGAGKDGRDGKDGLDGRDGKDGTHGKDGRDGIDGRDGTLRAAVTWERGKEYAHGTVASHRNGVWYSERATDDEPSTEASGWIMLADGLFDIEAVWDHEKDIRSFKLYIQMASGENIIHEMRVPFTQYREVWTDGEEYSGQDMVTHNGSLWMSLRDNNDTKPGTDAGVGFWKLAVKRGSDGKDGRRGQMGPQGLQGEKGDPGKDGRHGKDGIDGKDGADGKRGERGAPGKDGKDGADGATGPAGRAGDKFVSIEMDEKLHQLNFMKDDGGYLAIPMAKILQGVEKAINWRGPAQLGTTYRPGDLVSLDPSKVIICTNETNELPPATGDSVRAHPDWDIFVWVSSSKGGGKSIEIEDMWVLSEGIDIPDTAAVTIEQAVNELDPLLQIPENQVTIFGWNNAKYLYTANQRDHSVGVGGNYVTQPEDFYLLTETGITEILQEKFMVDDNGTGTISGDLNAQDFGGAGKMLMAETAYYIEWANGNVYVWEGVKGQAVGVGGTLVSTEDDFGLIHDGASDGSGGVEAPITQPGHGFTVLTCIRWDGTKYVRAQADDPDTTALGIVVSVDDADNFTFATIGRYENDDFIPTGLHAGEWYFLDVENPGGLDLVDPSISQPIVFCEAPNRIIVYPYRPSMDQISNPVEEAPADGQLYGRQDEQWVVVSGGGGGVPEAPVDGTAYVRQDAAWLQAGYLKPFTEDETVTVRADGSGMFTDLQEAIGYIMSRSIAAGQENSTWAQGKRRPMVTLDIGPGEWQPLSGNDPSTNYRVEGLQVRLHIKGSGSAQTTIMKGGQYSYALKISDCAVVSINGCKFVGSIDMSRSAVDFTTKGEEEVLDNDLSESYLYSQRNVVCNAYINASSDGIGYLGGAIAFGTSSIMISPDFASLPTALHITGITGGTVPLAADQQGSLSVYSFDPVPFVIGTNADNRASIDCGYGGEGGFVAISNEGGASITFDDDNHGETGPSINIAKGSTVNINCSEIIPSTRPLSNIPVATTQPDGSAWYDGVTVPPSGGGGGIDADYTYNIPGDYPDLDTAVLDLMSRNFLTGPGMGSPDFGSTDGDIPTILMLLGDGTHNKSIKWGGLKCMMRLRSASEDATLCTVSMTNANIKYCEEIRFDNVTVTGDPIVDRTPIQSYRSNFNTIYLRDQAFWKDTGGCTYQAMDLWQGAIFYQDDGGEMTIPSIVVNRGAYLSLEGLTCPSLSGGTHAVVDIEGDFNGDITQLTNFGLTVNVRGTWTSSDPGANPIPGLKNDRGGVVNVTGVNPSGGFLRDLQDTAVDAPPAMNDMLTWDGANWINVPRSSTTSEIEDINVDTATSGDLMEFNGTEWVPISKGKVVLDGLRELLDEAENVEAVSQLIKDIL